MFLFQDTEPQPESQSETATQTETKPSPNHKVVLINDEDHTYDYVVEMLVKVCELSRTQAFKCAVEVDLSGRTIVFFGDFEQCSEKADKINSFGPDHRMPKSMGSMRAEVEGLG